MISTLWAYFVTSETSVERNDLFIGFRLGLSCGDALAGYRRLGCRDIGFAADQDAGEVAQARLDR